MWLISHKNSQRNSITVTQKWPLSIYLLILQDGLKLAKEIAKIHYENKDVHLARDAMETAFKKYPSYVTAEDVNLMLEVLMHQQEYLRCIEILVLHSGVRLLHRASTSISVSNR